MFKYGVQGNIIMYILIGVSLNHNFFSLQWAVYIDYIYFFPFQSVTFACLPLFIYLKGFNGELVTE